MATNTSPDNLRGFIVPFALDAENQWDAQSTMTQGTRRAGLPDPAQSSALILQTSGLQGSSILDIKTYVAATGALADTNVMFARHIVVPVVPVE